MPIIKSALKKLRQDKTRRTRNVSALRNLRQAVNTARKTKKAEAAHKAYSAIDTAAKKQIIHKNRAGRLKSQIAALMIKKPQASATA